MKKYVIAFILILGFMVACDNKKEIIESQKPNNEEITNDWLKEVINYKWTIKLVADWGRKDPLLFQYILKFDDSGKVNLESTEDSEEQKEYRMMYVKYCDWIYADCDKQNNPKIVLVLMNMDSNPFLVFEKTDIEWTITQPATMNRIVEVLKEE